MTGRVLFITYFCSGDIFPHARSCRRLPLSAYERHGTNDSTNLCPVLKRIASPQPQDAARVDLLEQLHIVATAKISFRKGWDSDIRSSCDAPEHLSAPSEAVLQIEAAEGKGHP